MDVEGFVDFVVGAVVELVCEGGVSWVVLVGVGVLGWDGENMLLMVVIEIELGRVVVG